MNPKAGPSEGFSSKNTSREVRENTEGLESFGSSWYGSNMLDTASSSGTIAPTKKTQELSHQHTRHKNSHKN